MKTLKLVSVFFFLTISSTLFSQDNVQMEYVQYYFVELIPNPEKTDFTQEELQKIQGEHMQNIGKMAANGKLLLAGPFIEDGGGLFVLNVESKEAAENLVKEDPAVKAGRFIYKIKLWVTQKGLLSLEKD